MWVREVKSSARNPTRSISGAIGSIWRCANPGRAPQALVAVAERHVDELHLSHGRALEAARVGRRPRRSRDPRRSRRGGRWWSPCPRSWCGRAPSRSTRTRLGPVGAGTISLAIRRIVIRGDTVPPRRYGCRRGCPPRPGTRRGDRSGAGGGNPRSGSSALMPHSIAWPVTVIISWVIRRGCPSAIAICCSTRSMPVTASVTGCSTCMSRVDLQEANPTLVHHRNSTVPAPR